MNSLPDGLADALGRVVADVRQEFCKEFERVTADALALQSELRAENRVLLAEMRADLVVFKAELKAVADRELVRVPEVLASVKDGAPGKDGTNGIDGLKGKDGLDGRDGAAGVDGAPGKDGADGVNGKDIGPRDVQGMLAAEVAKAFSEFPQPKDGAPGKDGGEGIPGRDGRDGLPGVQGEKGLDGKDGKDGREGVDGFGFDDLTVEHDGERAVTIKWVQGDRVKEFPLSFPVTLYRGIYKSGTQYQRGDSVTFGGSTHIAEEDTSEKPEGGKGWRLAVKHGRDGKDGKNGAAGLQGLPGKSGRDLTQTDGSAKW